MGDACISGELKLPLMRYEVSLVPEHVAKRNVKDPLYCRCMDGVACPVIITEIYPDNRIDIAYSVFRDKERFKLE